MILVKITKLSRSAFQCLNAKERGALTRRGALLPELQHRVLCWQPSSHDTVSLMAFWIEVLLALQSLEQHIDAFVFIKILRNVVGI